MGSLTEALLGIIDEDTYDTDGNSEDNTKKKDVGPEALSQYTIFGGCYLATSSTIPTLPPGVYRPTFANERFVFQPLDVTGDSLMEFPDSKSEFIIKEIENFWGLKEQFHSFGFSHKRGILLHGEAGCGKSSLITIVMKKMIERNGLVILADHPNILSTGLQQLRQVEPNRQAVVIWEDLDAVIKRYGEPEVLAVLDGGSQVENILFIATTNFPEELEKRITNRPSRFDRLEKIDMPSAAARRMYLEAKVKTTEKDGVDLVQETEGFSIAHLRELIVSVWCLGRDVNETLDRLHGMSRTPKSGNSTSVGFGGKS